VGSCDWIAEGATNKEGGGVKQFDMDEFRIKPEHLKTLKPGAGVVGKAAARSKPVSGIKRRDAFAAVPLWWAARAVKGRANPNLLVCVDLVHRAWKAKGKTFTMPNGRNGVDRRTKARTLRTLERAGLIAVEWRERSRRS
jgi:hypothetical protein